MPTYCWQHNLVTFFCNRGTTYENGSLDNDKYYLILALYVIFYISAHQGAFLSSVIFCEFYRQSAYCKQANTTFSQLIKNKSNVLLEFWHVLVIFVSFNRMYMFDHYPDPQSLKLLTYFKQTKAE